MRYGRNALWAGLGLAALAAVGTPAAAQGPLDIFGSHFGGVRNPSLSDQAWAGASFMLLTQFDRRWDPGKPPVSSPPPFEEYDSLKTTVGYNYATVGRQWRFLNTALGGTEVTLAASIHGGFTKDSLLVARGQTWIHDFLSRPHVYREHVSDDVALLGLDVQALAWPGRDWFAIGPHLSLATFHRELGLSAASRVIGRTNALWITPLNLNVTAQLRSGWVGSSGIKPQRVAASLDGGYWSARLGGEYAEAVGLHAVYSSGIFTGESEVLFSGYLALTLSARLRFRVEFVNDILKNWKDSGPTGGARLVWSFRY